VPDLRETRRSQRVALIDNSVAHQRGTHEDSESKRTRSERVKDSDAITRLLDEFTAGRREAIDEVIPLVYDALRGIAHAHLRQERPGHTLNTTALVHEAYERLVKIDRIDWQGRIHFLAMASRVMRRILIDYAKARTRDKRGGPSVQHVPLEAAYGLSADTSEELIALDAALDRLELVSPRQARLVEYRFFGGLSLAETATALGVSLATVKRDWMHCRAWLNRELGGAEEVTTGAGSATAQPPPASR
jgi:RNA polymerase sigma factor (TIGR02999 family)